MTRIQMPNKWIQARMDFTTLNHTYWSMEIPKHIDTSNIRFDFPAWVINKENGPREFYDWASPHFNDWDIYMVFPNEAEAAIFKLKYL